MSDPLTIESLLASIGPMAIFEAKPRFDKLRLERAAAYPSDIRKRILRFLSTSEFVDAEDYAGVDYHEILKLVSAGQTPEQAHALFAVVPDHELATDIGNAANGILKWANGILPREMRDTMAGPVLDEPSEQSVADFARQWEIALNPMAVLRDLAEGCLSDDQVSALSTLYPALYAEMRQGVVDAATTLAARTKGKWEPDPLKEQFIAVLRGEPIGDLEMAAAVQTIYSQETQPAPAAKKPTAGSADDNGEQTPGQKAGAGQ